MISFVQLSDCKPEWAERQGKRQVADVPVRFIPVASPYDDEKSTAHSFSLALNLSSTPEVKTTTTTNEKGEKVKEKSYVKEGQVKQTVKKLCAGTAESYLKWKRQLDEVCKNKPCESSKAKLDMAEAMLYGDLLESWKLWRQTEGAVEVEKKFTKKETGEEYLKKVPRGDKSETYKACLGRLRNKFLKKFDARKQKAYMRSGLVKPRSLSVDSMSSRLKIMNNHLQSFPSPDNQSFSQGELIEIVLSMIPSFWIKSMATAGLEPREKTYEELIEHLEKLEVSIPEEVVKKDKPTVSFSEKDKKIPRKDKTYNRKGKDENPRASGQKSCELCKMMKGEDNPAWKTHNTEDCRSKKFYKKRMSDSGDRSSTYDKKARSGDYKKSYAIKKSTIRKEVRKALKRREAGYSSSDSSDSE